MIDIDDFREEYGEALAQAAEFARRKRKGTPTDRWATERQMHLVADGITAMAQIIEWQGEYLRQFVDMVNDADAA